MKKRKLWLFIKILLGVGAGVLLLLVGGGAFLYHYMGYSNPGNSSKYDVKNVNKLSNSPLKGKKIVFLGSSVTVGACAYNTSFVQYLQKKDSIVPIEEAVSGTTLTTSNGNNYISRMKKNLRNTKNIDGFVCQLSTNDVTFMKPIGKISNSYSINDFDTKTIDGSIEYVIAYAKKKWNCPVIFYTDTYYGSKKYQRMTNDLLKIQKKWNIKVLNMLDDKQMKKDGESHLKAYMANSIHPTKEGYLNWWTPEIENYLYKNL